MMRIANRNINTILISAVLTVLGGAPAIADDTEVLLVTQPDSSLTKPNVMFIFDTSGSMKTIQETGEPYDSDLDYTAGTCDTNKLYYTEANTIPVCDVNNTAFLDKSAWHCRSSMEQIDAAGQYSGFLVQYREGSSGNDEWLPLLPGNDIDNVECRGDRGVHGEYGGSIADVYARAGAGQASAWTSNQQQEVAWGSSGRNINYSVYDGNYLNFLGNSPTANMTRAQIMQEVTKNVLNSVSNMNVGFMRFNRQDGGPIVMAMQDLDENREEILSMVDTMRPLGWTPLSETLFESALIWQGLPAHYGELINNFDTDPLALASNPPEVYKQPEVLACSKNFNVLITDGAPTEDIDTPELLGQLPGYSTVLGRTGCTGEGDGACLDDVSEYLSKIDLDDTLDGQQSVVTHTIGYAIDLPLLRDTAAASGGEYLLADDVETLTRALTEVVALAQEKAVSFAAPAVSVNTFNRTRNLNSVYMTLFDPRGKAHWPGNLKAYEIKDGNVVDVSGANAIDPDTGLFFDSTKSFWTVGEADGNNAVAGGAANQLPEPDIRNLYTDNGDTNLKAGSNEISQANKEMYVIEDFGFAGTGPSKEDMIDWMRGADVKNDDGDDSTLVRNAMGDPLHAQPAVVVYGGSTESPETVVYTATNDGYLHAIDGASGVELWAYVPNELLPNMARLYDDADTRYKLYGLDGNIVPVVRDVNGNGSIEALDGDFVYLLFGMRRGGSTYRMLDVTDKNSPILMWERVLDGGGQSWSTPVISRMDISGVTQNSLQAVVVLGGGYDAVHDTAAFNPASDGAGAGVHVLDLVSGETIWRAGDTDSNADLELESMTRAIPTSIKVVDINGDSLADRMYAADLGGQIWRFDITNGRIASDLVAGGVIAQLGAEGLPSPAAADTRRFYNAPDVAMFNDTRQNRRFMSISIGSGYRAHPLDTSSADRFYSLRDPNVFNSLSQSQYESLTPITEQDLVDVSGQVDVAVTQADAGWMMSLPNNEMVLSDSITFNDEIFFVTFSPDSAGASVCNAGQGMNWLYRVNIINGDPVIADTGTILPGNEDAARREPLTQGGIAPSPQFLFPNPDPDCTGPNCMPPPIGCIGLECFDPGFVNNPVRTLWTQDGIE